MHESDLKKIIEIDTKILLHFLKENKIFRQFLKKIHNNISDKPKNIEEWINDNLNLIDVYNQSTTARCDYVASFRKSFKDDVPNNVFYIATNPNLLQCTKLFSDWGYAPITLSLDPDLEWSKWKDVTHRFIKLKILLYQINAFNIKNE